LNELPVYNWRKLQETNDLAWLIRGHNEINPVNISDAEKKDLAGIFENLIYSVDSVDLAVEKSIAELLSYELDMIINPERKALKTQIYRVKRIINEKINSRDSETKKLNYTQIDAILEEWLKFQIDIKKMSVNLYNNHLANYNKYCENQSK
jgi:hypothetical protein